MQYANQTPFSFAESLFQRDKTTASEKPLIDRPLFGRPPPKNNQHVFTTYSINFMSIIFTVVWLVSSTPFHVHKSLKKQVALQRRCLLLTILICELNGFSFCIKANCTQVTKYPNEGPSEGNLNYVHCKTRSRRHPKFKTGESVASQKGNLSFKY